MRITCIGAAFLCVVAVIPPLIRHRMNILAMASPSSWAAPASSSSSSASRRSTWSSASRPTSSCGNYGGFLSGGEGTKEGIKGRQY